MKRIGPLITLSIVYGLWVLISAPTRAIPVSPDKKAFIERNKIAASVETTEMPRHINVYRKEGWFGGWPANHGIWSWGNEILVGFDAGPFERKKSGHAINYRVTPQQLLARSRDGGETWTIEHPPDLELPIGVDYQGFPPGKGRPLTECPGKINFLHPDFAFTARMTVSLPSGADLATAPERIRDPGFSRFYYSYNRGKTWKGPFKLPNFGHSGTAARTDYIVNGKNDLSLFTTLARSDGTQGRAAMVRTRDGGKTWELASYIGPEPLGEDYSIMPATVRLGPETLFTVVRHRGFLKAYRSTDGGKRWLDEGQLAKTGKGNPASLIKLQDGRLGLTYGYRTEPFGIRARLSEDWGKSWGEEIILRDDGGNNDIGYPRSVQRPDGKIVTVYYYNVDKDKERFIGATIWEPTKIGTAVKAQNE